MKKVFTLSILFFCISNLISQSNLWEEKKYEEINIKGKQYIYPEVFKTFHLDLNKIKNQLATAPLQELDGNIFNSNIEIIIPLPDGKFELFKIVESPVYEAGFSTKFPDIKTYLAYAPNHPEWYSRFDMTPLGFHAIILGTEQGTIYIDPITHLGEDVENYLVYYKKDFTTDKIFECGLEENISTQAKRTETTASRFGSCELRTYRLALAATGEYTQFHGGTVANALAAQVTSINRVNAVYERDMSIHLNIISDNDNIIYTNSNTDPYTNNNGSSMLGENQTNIDAVIGSANYDIGHVFSTGGGGVAMLQSPCNNSTKARGVTGSSSPVNDPFDIDYVCHEMGHQFGGNHTFNGTNGSCGGGNRNLATAFEPGSGTTIQAYAGICTGQNVQSNSDDYFHGISLEEIGDFITGAGHTCPVKTSLSNNDPTVTYPSSTITIPANTPFALTAAGSDPDGNIITYCWEQMNSENSTQPPVANATGGPNFRSFSPTTNPTRYFPNLADVIAGNAPTWEVLPSVTRTLDFRVVVRDNAPGGGCNDHTDITVEITNSAGPFIVNYPNNNGIVWDANTNETVTWDVANTASAPVSCSTVNILISYDGGFSFPDTIAKNVVNDGSQPVTVPNVATTDAYIMVQCSNGTFFDVSNNNFTINAVTNDFSLNVNNTTQNICVGQNAVYNIDINKIGTFNGNVSLSTSGIPSGISTNFSANNNAPDFTSTLTLSNTNSLSNGTYNFDLNATGSTGTKTINLTLNAISNLSGTINLTTPINNATSVIVPTDFAWSPVLGTEYSITISTDINQSNVIETINNLTNNSYTSSSLQTNTTYYWSVIAYNTCDSIISNVNSFTTENCANYVSNDIPITISTSGTPTITSDLVISGTVGTIADVNVINLTGTHSWISDLTFTLSSPNGTDVILLEEICSNQNNFDINFDDDAANNNYPCPPIDGGFYIPEEALSAFNGEDANGTWVLTVEDSENQDGGELVSWGLNLCFNPPPCTNVFNTITLAPACDSIFVANNWYYTNTSFNDTLTAQAANGCDSIVTYHVTVNNSKTSNENLSACNSANINGNTYTSSQVISNTFTATNGCDSIHTINLTINYSSPPITINQTTCDNANVGTSTTTFSNTNGCDSVVTINTTLNSSSSSTQNITTCDSALVNGTWYFNNTSFTQTLNGTAANGCDSTITYNITINNSKTSNENLSACNSANINGNTYTSSQVISNTFTAANGCDSIHTIYLTINYNSPPTTVNQTTCDNANVGTSTTTFSNTNGCDSVVTINTTLGTYSSSTINLTPACDSIFAATNWYYHSTSFNDTLIGQANGGCDSIVTYNLTVNNSVSNTETFSDCDSVLFNNVWYTSSQQFNFSLTSADNCDSTYTVNINIGNNIDTTVIQNNNLLTAQQNGAQYQWLDCDNGFTPILGANSQTFTATSNGNYAVEINLNGCAFISSSCYNVNTIGIKDNILSENLQLYPNPTNGKFTIELNTLIETLNIKIFSVEGKIISQHNIQNQLIIPLNIETSAGIYFVELTSAKGNAIIKIIKE